MPELVSGEIFPKVREMVRCLRAPYLSRPPIITLCGSTRFKRAWAEWNVLLTLSEAVVLSVAMGSHSERQWPTEEQKELLDYIHKKKIDISDAIFVLNVDGYIGDSTRSEIDHATRHNKMIVMLTDEFPDWKEDDCTFAQHQISHAVEDRAVTKESQE